MNGFVGTLIDTSDFPARWYCGNWTDFHGWVHVISDVAIFGAYTAIPVVLAYFLLKKGDLTFPAIGWLFCTFILACGISHLVEAGIFWWPAYRVAGTMKVITASVSWLTVLALIRILPGALELPGLVTLNKDLAYEIEQRNAVEIELRQHKEALQEKVDAQTRELRIANQALEAEVRESKRTQHDLEKSNQALQDFAHIASHDLQEPLRKIRTFGGRLEAAAEGALNERAEDDLRRIIASSMRMQTMIDGLLDYSRVSSQRRVFGQVNLDAILDDVMETFDSRIAQESAEIIREPLPTIAADATQMNQLFQNLIGNALKFRDGDEPARITIRSESVPNQQVRILVEDNGIGIDPAHAKRLFQPFTRLNPRQAYEGSGIGLSICRKIVERHHGSISVEGRPGEGTTFVITLPEEPIVSSSDFDVSGGVT